MHSISRTSCFGTWSFRTRKQTDKQTNKQTNKKQRPKRGLGMMNGRIFLFLFLFQLTRKSKQSGLPKTATELIFPPFFTYAVFNARKVVFKFETRSAAFTTPFLSREYALFLFFMLFRSNCCPPIAKAWSAESVDSRASASEFNTVK